MENSAKSADVTESHPERPGIRRRSYRLAIAVVVLLLIAGAAVFGFAMLNRNKNTPQTDNNNEATTATADTEKKVPAEETKSTEKTEEVSPENSTSKEPEIIDGKTPASMENNSVESNGLTGVINYAESDGETVSIRVSIDQYLNGGTCYLELKSPTTGDTFSLTDEITPAVSTSTCSYDIATKLLINGKYDIQVTLSSDGKEGIIKGEVDV